GAGAALGDAAAILGAGHAERVAQHPQKRRARIGVGLHGLAVDVEHSHGGLLSARYAENGRPYRAAESPASHRRVTCPSSDAWLKYAAVIAAQQLVDLIRLEPTGQRRRQLWQGPR